MRLNHFEFSEHDTKIDLNIRMSFPEEFAIGLGTSTDKEIKRYSETIGNLVK